MSFRDKQNEEKIITVNDQLNIINNDEKKFDMSIVIHDQGIIKYCINISIETMDDNQIKIPTTIMVKMGIINNRTTNYSLEIKQVYNNLSISYDGSIWETTILDAKETDTNKIINIITEYLKSFEGLKDDNNLKTGLAIINESLTNNIDYILSFWSSFDANSYIENLKEMIQGYKSDYLQKIAPIQKRIELLTNMKSGMKK